MKKPREPSRLYVLDTNVLMHDPTCIFRFQEHDIFLPMVVLEELDAGKKGLSEASRNVREIGCVVNAVHKMREHGTKGCPNPPARKREEAVFEHLWGCRVCVVVPADWHGLMSRCLVV